MRGRDLLIIVATIALAIFVAEQVPLPEPKQPDVYAAACGTLRVYEDGRQEFVERPAEECDAEVEELRAALRSGKGGWVGAPAECGEPGADGLVSCRARLELPR
jgi:hypothetical protein